MLNRNGTCALFFVLIGLSACSSITVPLQYTENERYQYVSTLLASKHYHDALIQLRILRTMYPSDRALHKEIRRLEKAINKASKDYFVAIENKADPEQKKQALINILTLDPSNEQAFSLLRELELEREMAAFNKKEKIARSVQKKQPKTADESPTQTSFRDLADTLIRSKDYRGVLSLLDTHVSSTREKEVELNEYKAVACEKLGHEYYQQEKIDKAIEFYECSVSANADKSVINRLKQIRETQSQAYYEQGIKLFKLDVKQAIEMFERSLFYKPSNLQAKRRLVMAKTIYDNLTEIKGATR